jgi:hypothetical protein
MSWFCFISADKWTVLRFGVATCAAGFGFNIPIPNPPIRQAQRPAATQKMAIHF